MSKVADIVAKETPAPTETRRVVGLPTSPADPESDRAADLAEFYTDRLRIDGEAPELLPIQALALAEFADVGGLLGAIAVGAGKTLIALLLPRAVGLDGEDALLIHPASTRDSLNRERKKWRGRYDIADPHRMSYHRLSQPGGFDRLVDIAPRVIVADEAHYFRRTDSARTRRLRRYASERPVACAFLSGTLTSRSIEDYAHLAEFALGRSSPIPLEYTTRQSWARCLDVESSRADYAELSDWREIQPLVDEFGDNFPLVDEPVSERRDRAREAFERRFRTAPGVVRTTKASVGATLRYATRSPGVPTDVWDVYDQIAVDFELPCGQEIDDPLDKDRALRQISSGFYYRWDWSARGGVDREWLYARRRWRSEVADVIRYGPADLDSPYKVREAFESGEYESDDLEDAWCEWAPHRHKDPPPTESVWIDDFAVRDVLETTRKLTEEGAPPLVWYTWEAEASKIDELSDAIDVCYPDARGPDPEALDGDHPAAVSIHSAREGMNLQQWASNLVLNPPSSGLQFEQLVGRTHRQGQTADRVVVVVYQHTPRHKQSLEDAREDARYVAQTQSTRQKLLYGDWTGSLSNLLR